MLYRDECEAPAAGVTARTRSRIVTFTRPFHLSALDEQQPAGAYTIETDEEMIGSVSFPAYRRSATWIRLPARISPAGAPAGLDRVINIDPTELENALARDVAVHDEGTAPGTVQWRDARALRTGITSTPREISVPRARRSDRGVVKFTIQDWLDANKSALTWIALAVFGLLILRFVMPFDIPMR